MEPILIEIKQDMPGFSGFIGSWLCMSGRNVLVDVGPANSSQYLMDELDLVGVERLDYILLTHIHIDHSGALAEVLARYPEAKAICHSKAVNHLVNPAALWESSLKSLGPIAEGYGIPKKVDDEKVIPHTKFVMPGLTIMETPGHAVHHLSFCFEKRLFPGEAGGVYRAVGGMKYMRPATPPKLYYDIFMNSLGALLFLKDMPIYFAHLGKCDNSQPHLRQFKDQMTLWRDIISGEIKKGENDLEDRCLRRLIAKDSHLNAFLKMEPIIMEREKFFIRNSIKGFIGYLRRPNKSS
ncbi:MBL fold metallo-hydrolase [Thermodesulfobacteriota bacterium]